MKAILEIEIECGQTTCASEPGKFCKYLGSTPWGQIPICLLFPQIDLGDKVEGSYAQLGTEGGWVQRCRGCLEAQI